MKKRTYKNMLKATKIVEEKGYDWSTANEIAMECFDKAESLENGMTIEWFIDKIACNV